MLNQLTGLFRSFALICLFAAVPSVSMGAAISASGHYFKRPSDVNPIILLNSDQAYWMVTFSQFDYVKYLDQMASYGMNFVRIYPGATPIEDSINYSPPLYADMLPWVKLPDGKYDLDQWNEDYFARLRNVVDYADKKGVIVDVCFFNGIGNWWLDMWRHMPMNPALNTKIPPTTYLGTKNPYWFVTLVNPTLVSYQEKYVQEVVKRLADFDNVIYDVADEPDAGVNSLPAAFQPTFLADMKLWVDRMLQVAHDADLAQGNKHLIAQTYATQIPDMSGDSRTGWVSLEYRAAIANVGRLWDRNKPLGHVESLPIIQYPQNAIHDTIRVESWETLTAGAASYLQFNDSCSVATPTGNARTPGVLANLKVLKMFISSFSFWKMSPNTKNVTVAMSTQQSNARFSSLAEPGRQYAFYLHVSKPAGVAYEVLPAAYTAAVTLKNVPAGNYQVEWLRPSAGRIMAAHNQIHSGGNLVLNAPEFRLDVAARIMDVSIAKPVVMVAALDGDTGGTGSGSGTFQVTRTGNANTPLKVYFALTRKFAASGSVSTSPKTVVTIPAGALVTTVNTSALDNTSPAPSNEVSMTLIDGPGYKLGMPSTATLVF